MPLLYNTAMAIHHSLQKLEKLASLSRRVQRMRIMASWVRGVVLVALAALICPEPVESVVRHYNFTVSTLLFNVRIKRLPATLFPYIPTFSRGRVLDWAFQACAQHLSGKMGKEWKVCLFSEFFRVLSNMVLNVCRWWARTRQECARASPSL